MRRVFSDYVALVKNLRGVVLVSPQEASAEELVQWLGRRFRYRNVGVAPAAVVAHSAFFAGRLEGRPFLELAFPLESVAAVARAVADVLGLSLEVAQGVVLASAYASPLIALGRWAADALEPLTVDRVQTLTPLDDRGWRLHLRIADYSVLDLYRWSTAHARGLWRGPGEDFLGERRRRIARDRRRYWRLQAGPGPERPFLRYLDLAQVAAREPSLGEGLASLPPEEACAALAIVAAVVVLPEG